MDLNLNLSLGGWISGKKHVDRRLIWLLGLLGVALVVAAVWLAISEWRLSRSEAEALAEGEFAVGQLLEPVQSVKRVLNNEQVQALALRALDNPETIDDLFAYVNGRMNEILEVRVFPRDLSGIEPEALGPNGFAMLDMLLSALEGNTGLLQIHYVLQPPVMLDAVPIRSGEEMRGVLVASMSPDLIVSAFQPPYSALGVIRLSQYNGAQNQSILREVGDVSLLGEVPERIAIPGTLLRVEYPLQQRIELMSPRWLMVMLLVGLACQAAAFLLWRGNQKWALDRQIEKAKRKRD